MNKQKIINELIRILFTKKYEFSIGKSGISVSVNGINTIFINYSEPEYGLDELIRNDYHKIYVKEDISKHAFQQLKNQGCKFFYDNNVYCTKIHNANLMFQNKDRSSITYDYQMKVFGNYELLTHKEVNKYLNLNKMENNKITDFTPYLKELGTTMSCFVEKDLERKQLGEFLQRAKIEFEEIDNNKIIIPQSELSKFKEFRNDKVESIGNTNVLDEAKELITGDRAKQYGPMIDNFKNIVAVANILLKPKGKVLDVEDVANILVALKIARQANGYKRDSVVDAAAYLNITDVMHEFMEE